MQTTYVPKIVAVISAFPVNEVAESGVTLTVIVTIETVPAYFPDGNLVAPNMLTKAYLVKVPL